MIAYGSKSTAVNTNGTNFNLAYMGGISAGDLLIIAAISVQEGGTIGTINTPAGFLPFPSSGGGPFSDSALNNVGPFRCFYRIADGTESGNVAMSRTGHSGGISGSTPFFGQMYRYTCTGNAILAEAQQNILGNGNATISFTSIGGPLGMTKMAFVAQLTGNPGTPAGYTARASDDNSGGGTTPVVTIELSDVENTSGSGAATASGGHADGWATVHASFFEPAGYVYIPDH